MRKAVMQLRAGNKALYFWQQANHVQHMEKWRGA